MVSTDPIIVESSLSKKYYDTLYSMTRFTLPFKEPSIHTDFSVSLWDRQGLFKDDRLLGSTNKLKFDKALGNSLSYFNLYGSLIPDNMCLDLAEKNIMNCHPSIASGYLGRVLLKYYIMDNENSDTKVVINKSFKSSFVEENEISFITNGDIISNNIYSTVDHKFLPTTKQYIMTVKAYMGQGLPMISKLFKSTVPKFAVKFSIFDYEIVTDEQIIQNDMIFWNNDKNSNNNSIIMTLSENIDYIPDLFVYLLRDSLPVCYYRLRITDLLNIATFEPKWYELYADKTLVEEAKEYFNSSLLLSISFKVFDNDKSQISKEVTIFEREPTVSPYRLIIDVFQCKNLRSMDNFGLSDPYITFKICGKNVKTTIKKKTNDPQYFETLLLENIEMPDNPFYFPFLFIECLDSDLIGNDNIGFLKYSLKDYALIDDYSSDSDIYCSPKWFNFSSKSYHPKQEEVEYSSIGSILLRVRLFKLPLKSNICAPPSIAPVLKVFRMEILIYGIRHLKSASSMVPIMKPYLVLTSNETKIATLEPVRLCSSKNPNYCARITFDMRLPRESILSPNIYLSVYDKRLGSFTDSHIGLASIDLKSYYPNNSHDNFGKFKTGNPYHVDYLSTNSNADVNLNDFQNANNLPSYLINRKFLSVSLEDTLGNTPFQIYNIVTGKVEGSILDTKCQQIGSIKCLMQLFDSDENQNIRNDSLQMDLIYKSLRIKEKVIIRVYILQAKNLIGKDDNNKSDPFLKVSLGDKKYNTRDRYLKKTLNPSFYTSFEFKHTFPDYCELRIDIMDRDTYNFDDLLGSTVIDLEDRFYYDKLRNSNIYKSSQLQPVEQRFLWNPNSSIPNGTLSLWIDILPEDEAKKRPMSDITRMTEEWEIRIVIWKACDFKAGDQITGMNDLQVRCSMLDNVQSTDIHYLLDEDEEGSFNWRMKFPIKLPIDSEEEGNTRLNIQVWDYDILFSDLLDEINIDLREELEKCYSRYVKVKETTAAPYFVWSFFSEKDEEEKARKRYIHELQDIESGAHNGEKVPLIKRKKKKKVSLFKRFTAVIFNEDNEPENSKWISFPGNGKVLMSIEMLPKKVAEIMKNGLGRNEPNCFPELPGPIGRVDFLKMAYNPFYFFRSILGKKNCFRFQIFLMFVIVGILYKFVIEPFLGFFQMIYDICYKVVNPIYIIVANFMKKHYDEVKHLDNQAKISIGFILIIIISLLGYCFFRFIFRKCKCLRCCRCCKKKKRNIYNAIRLK